MNSLRSFARRHLSETSLHLFLVVGLFALFISGETFVKNVEMVFDDIDRDIAPAIVIKHESLGPPPSLEVPDRSLALGEKSREVLLLQNFLNWRGLWPEGEELSSYFGEITLESVKKYQETKNIKAEGIVGPLTRNAWQRDLEEATK